MTKEIRKELNQAKRLYKTGKKEDAYEIYDEIYAEHPEKFDKWDKIRYCWSIYYLFIRDSNDEYELEENVKRVTEIVKQEDLNNAPVCVYTQSVFKIVMHFKSEGACQNMLYWLDKLNPELLSEDLNDGKNSAYPSKKEEYYKFLSIAHLSCGDYEECIDVSRKALDMFETFALNGDTWHRWRIAKSLKQLDRPQEALTYLEEVVKVQQDWFILKEFAENHHMLGDDESALRYASQSALKEGPVEIKVNLYFLIYDILKETDPDLALQHAKLYLALKLQSGAPINEEIEELGIDEENLDIDELENEIYNYWREFQ